MPTISWDEAGARYYEAGVDRAVLYPPNGNGVAWNGLVSVTEQVVGGQNSSIYFDGVKYADTAIVSEFAGTLRAYTYPDELLEFEGTDSIGNGLYVTNQQSKKFGLTYRTKVGNDEDGIEHSYKIHILYNVTVVPTSRNYQSITTNINPIVFEWNITAIPSEIPGFRPSAHLIFDTSKMSPSLVSDLEDTLYGDGVSLPKLPPASTLAAFIGNWVIIRITDNMNGTWTAEGPDNLIQFLDPTSFQITSSSAKFIDAFSYNISDLTYY